VLGCARPGRKGAREHLQAKFIALLGITGARTSGGLTVRVWPCDEVISTSFAQSQVNQGHDIKDVTLEQEQLNIGPITHSRAKKLQKQVTSLLAEFKIHANENCLLPKSCTFIVLRFTHKDMDDTKEEKGYVQSRMGYTKTNKIAVPTKTSYMHKTLGYTAEASSSRTSLYESTTIHGA
jgi:hypothetical protein